MRFHRAAVFVCAGLIASLGSAAFAQNFVKPGDTVSIPFPVENAVDSGDTINSMKVVVTGGSAFVTSPTDSATQSLALGEVKTFTPTFVVGNVLDGSYTVTLKQVSTDVGLDPDPDDPASDTSVLFPIVEDPFFVGAQFRSVWQGEAFGGLKFRRERRAYGQAFLAQRGASMSGRCRAEGRAE